MKNEEKPFSDSAH